MDGHNIRVVIADDHPVVRIGLELELKHASRIDVVGSACNSTELIELLGTRPCDVTVLDYTMPGGAHGDGLELIDHLRQRFAQIAIAVLTGADRPALIRGLLMQGITSIVSKTDAGIHVVPAIKAAAIGRSYYSPSIAAMPVMAGTYPLQDLSPRETEVLSLFASGASVNDIALRLQRSKQTVSSQKISAMAKLGIQSEAELFAYVAETGLFDPA
jgi:two-component system capsular synthesis response regulator RcsB